MFPATPLVNLTLNPKPRVSLSAGRRAEMKSGFRPSSLGFVSAESRSLLSYGHQEVERGLCKSLPGFHKTFEGLCKSLGALGFKAFSISCRGSPKHTYGPVETAPL